MNQQPITTTTTILLDASSLKHSGCILALYNIVVKGYRSPTNANDIEFGVAFHHFKKKFAETGDEDKSRAEAVNYFKTAPMTVKFRKTFLDVDYLRQACMGYAEHYTGDEYKTVVHEGKPLVELRIAYPYYRSPEGDIEIILCGTIDEIVRNTIADFYCIKDFKTTSLWDKDKYFSSYALSSQLMFYTLLLQLYAKAFPDNIVSKITNNGTSIGCFIDGIFLASGKEPSYARSEVFWFKEKTIKEFKSGLDSVIARLVEVIRDPSKLYREGIIINSCEKVYGPCNFFGACCEEDEDYRETFLKENFIIKPYNPMQHGEVKPQAI